MIKEGSNYRVSASDLVDTIACAHRSRLNQAVASGELLSANSDSEFDNLFVEHGHAHEKRVLNAYKAAHEVLEFDLDQVKNSPGGYAAAARQTLDAIKRRLLRIRQTSRRRP